MIILFLEMIYIHYCLKNQFYSLFYKIVLHKKTNTLIFQIYHNLMLNIVHQIVPSYLLCISIQSVQLSLMSLFISLTLITEDT